jgi:hypothetical protein
MVWRSSNDALWIKNISLPLGIDGTVELGHGLLRRGSIPPTVPASSVTSIVHRTGCSSAITRMIAIYGTLANAGPKILVFFSPILAQKFQSHRH